jgi:VWFA-related protein
MAEPYYTVREVLMTPMLARSIAAFRLLVAGAVLSAAPGYATGTQSGNSQPQTPVFRAGVEVVSLDVSVVDSEGRPVTGLTVDDFAVELDGKKQPVRVVDYFEFAGAASPQTVPEAPLPAPGRAAPRPGQLTGRSILIGIDDLSFRTQQAAGFAADARRLIASLGGNDSVGVMTTAADLPLAPISRDKTRATLALGSIIGRRTENSPDSAPQRLSGTNAQAGTEIGISNADALAIHSGNDTTFGELTLRLCGRRAALAAPSAGGACAVGVRSEAMLLATGIERTTTMQVDNYRQMIAILREEAPPRVLVLMSGGLDTDADHSPWMSTLQSDALAAGVRIHVLLPGLSSGNDASDRSAMRSRLRRENDEFGRRGIEMVAARLDADIYRVVGEATPAFNRMVAGWSGSYRVGVDPPAGRRSGVVPVKVTVKRPGTTVHTASSVMIRTGPAAASTRTDGAPAVPRSTEETLARLVDGTGSADDVPLAVGARSKRDEAGQDVQVVTIEVPGRVTGPLSGLFAATDAANQVIQRGTITFTPPSGGDDYRISVVVPIAPGGYRLRVAVVDGTGAAGLVEHSGTARLGRLRSSSVSDMLLSWVGDDGKGRFVAMEAVPEAARVLQASVEVYSAADAAGTVVRMALLKEGGAKPVAEAQASPVKMAGGWRAGVSVPLASLDPGVYEVRATVQEGTDPPLVLSRTVRKLGARSTK